MAEPFAGGPPRWRSAPLADRSVGGSLHWRLSGFSVSELTPSPTTEREREREREKEKREREREADRGGENFAK